MMTPADSSGYVEDAATTEPTENTLSENSAPGVTEPQAARVTAELSAVDLEAAEPEEKAPSAPAHPVAARFEAADEPDDGATREVPRMSRAALPPQPAEEAIDPDATILRAQPRPLASSAEDHSDDHPMTEPAPARPRYNTLASTFNRQRSAASDPSARAPQPTQPMRPAPQMAPPPAPVIAQPPTPPFTPLVAQPPTPPSTPPIAQRPTPPSTPFIAEFEHYADDDDEIVDEVDDEEEWSLADQPTVQWTPQQIAQMQGLKPDFMLDTGEQASWPPRPVAQANPDAEQPWRADLPPRPRPPFPLYGVPQPQVGGDRRLAAPDGRVAPAPPSASTAGAQPDPRMERFQELRRQRFAHGQGERDDADPQPVADTMRQWWADLRPAVEGALHYQREARASGMHPIPAYEPTEPTQMSRLGDAFGRLAASARELSDRAQQAAAPTIKRLHDQVEQAAQGLISRFEGDPVRQQAPLLGPGRIAVFFRQGVSVGQAQRLLAASAARPMRLIPRKHGFLARVMPGKESEVCERLRMHPYVRDVAFLEYNDYGEPVGGRR